MAILDNNIPALGNSQPTQFQTLTVVAAVLAALSLLWAFVDTRMVDGALVWMKPLKFSLSFVALFGTIALLETRMSAPVRTGWPMRIVGWVMAAAFLAEMVYMMYQASRGEASHFNLSTPFNALMYSTVMGLGAVLLVLCIGIIGWLVKRDVDATLSNGLREAIWLGFLISFVLTMIVAGYMSSSTGHFVGTHPEGAPVVPLLGWSGVTGDLRPAHFLSLHAMQVLPLMVLVLQGRMSVSSVRLSAIGYSVLTFAVFGMALAGVPLIPLGP